MAERGTFQWVSGRRVLVIARDSAQAARAFGVYEAELARLSRTGSVSCGAGVTIRRVTDVVDVGGYLCWASSANGPLDALRVCGYPRGSVS